MSTVDPVAARRLEENSPPGVAVIIAALAAQVLGGLGVGVELADRQLGGRSLLTVITVLAFVLAVFFLVTGILADRRRRATGQLEDEIVHTGTMFTAIVSAEGYEIFTESTRILAT